MLLVAVECVRKIAAKQVSDSVYTAGDGSEFTSNKLMREERYKHLRLRRNPDEKYNIPVTTSMAVGFSMYCFSLFKIITVLICFVHIYIFNKYIPLHIYFRWDGQLHQS